MDDLRELLSIIKDMPSFALWVIAGLLVYKVTVIGSIYGVVRLGLVRLFDWLSLRKRQDVELRPTIDGMCITGVASELVGQLARLKWMNQTTEVRGPYIHSCGVGRLRRALDLLEAQEAAEAAGQSKPPRNP